MQSVIISSRISVQEDETRYAIESDKDLEGCFVLTTEYWNEETNKWETSDRMECIPSNILEWFSKTSKILLKVENVNS